MDLLDVLKSNGTGLLEGLCRPHNRNGSFRDLKVLSEMEVDFSFGMEKLGTYKVRVIGFSDSESKPNEIDPNCTIIGTENEGMGISVRIIIGSVGDFGRFVAHDLR